MQPPPGYMPPPPRPGGPPGHGFPPGSMPAGMMMPPPGMMMRPQMLPPPGMMPPGMSMPPLNTLQTPAPLTPPAPMRPPSNYIRPLQLPKPGSVPKPRPSGSGATKSTTLYVGKIAATVDDKTVQRLLEACGPVKSWKRMSDPETNKPKGFGFCEFEEADAVVRSLQHLSNLDVDGQTLLVKCNAATQKYVDEYKARKVIDAAAARAAAEEAAEAARAAKESKDSKGDEKDGEKDEDVVLPPPPGDPDAFKDEQCLEKIMNIISERAPATSTAAAAAASSADRFLGGLSSRSGREPSRHGRESSRSIRDEDPEERKARDLETAFERSREKERREAESAAAAADRTYKDHVRRLERAERDRQRDVEARLDAKAAAVKARARAVRADEDESFEDDLHLPAWRRADLSTSRRRQTRREKRTREEKEDAADREADNEERRLRRSARSQSRSGSPSPSPAAKRKQQLAVQQQRDAAAAAAVAAYDADDPIYRAMVAAAQAAPRPAAAPSASLTTAPDRAGPPPAHALVQQQPQQEQPQQPPAQTQQPQMYQGYASPAVAKESGLASAFGDDEDEQKPRRKLVPLQYSPAELVAARAGPQLGPEELAKAKAQVMQQLPSAKEDIFGAHIDWALFDMARGQLLTRLAAFVDKKITEMLGEQETTLVTHVMEQLQAHVTAQAMLDDLTAILDDDAVMFVMKLYRAVLFDITKLAKFGSL